MIRTYSELMKLHTFDERFLYLKLDASVGADTFGFDRYMNQQFYRSAEWKSLRNKIIARDNACDLGIPDHDIHESIVIHHMNPICTDDIIHSSDFLLNPEYLICVTKNTHNAIHYGGFDTLKNRLVERTPNDTCPWRK